MYKELLIKWIKLLKMKRDSLIFATTNEGKLKEAKDILGVDIISEKIELDEIQSLSFEEVIEHKAKQAYSKIGKPVLVEDSGIIFNALGKLPGVFTKWFLKSVELNDLVKLCEIKNDFEASAVSYFGIFDGTSTKIGIGIINGKVVAPRGTNGFGWDSIFVPNGSSQTFGEMDGITKNLISMRKLALENLLKQINN